LITIILSSRPVYCQVNDTTNVAGEKEYATVLKDMNENMVRFLESQVKKTAAMKIESR